MEFPLSDIQSLSSATRAFLNNEPSMLDLLGKEHPYLSIEKAVSGKAGYTAEKREILTRELSVQYDFLKEPDPTATLLHSNIAKLSSANAYTVSTGQQLHLFAGPAFVLYKALATIRLAEDYKKKFPGNEFIPVYWLASEDHDIDEIRDNVIFNKNFRWNTLQTGPCGRFSVGEVPTLLDEMLSTLTLSVSGETLLKQFREIYSSSSSLSEATIRCIHMLFGTYGLICIDADRPAFKALFRDVMRKDILEQACLPVFEDFSARLESAGFSRQLHGREINFFYMTDGSRKRIVKEDSGFAVVDSEVRFSVQEMERLISENPACLSPNAMLRPLYQETVLPNVAYVGGNAEVNYWLQILNVFTINKISPPKLILRPSVWIIPVKSAEWLHKQEISPLEVLISQNEADLLKLAGGESKGLSAEINAYIELRQKIQDIAYQHNIKEMKILAEAGKIYEKTLRNFDKQVLDAEKNRAGEKLGKISSIHNNYLNTNTIQERKTHALEMLIKHDNVVFTLYKQGFSEAGKGYIVSI